MGRFLGQGQHGIRTKHAAPGLLALAFVLMFVAQAHAAHVSCGDTLTQDTTLDSDLVDCPGTGVVLGADAITLDLGGYMIDGAGRGAGATNQVGDDPGFNNVTVRGGAIKEFAAGVAFTSCSGCAVERTAITASNRGVVLTYAAAGRIERNAISSSRSEGVLVNDSPANEIAHNAIHDNGSYGIAMNNSSSNAVSSNSLWLNGRDGIFGFASDDLRLVRNFVDRNGRYGLSLGFLLRSEVRGNLASRNGKDGIALPVSVRDGRVAGNAALWNSGNGISLGLVDRNRVIANVVAGNGASGILLGDEFGIPRETYVAHNLAVANTLDGIAVSALATGTTLRANTARGNDDDGIDVAEPATALGRNIAWANDDLGIEAVEGVSDEGRNRAKKNGNRLQCTNVVCRSGRGRAKKGDDADERLCDDGRVVLKRQEAWLRLDRDGDLLLKPVMRRGARWLSHRSGRDFFDDPLCDEDDRNDD